MSAYTFDELERAFQRYWRTGAVGEDWDAWADLFTADAEYVEHVLGNLHGRETIRAWIKPIMAQYCELYTAYEWHTVDPAGGRVVFYMQNRRDHPGGTDTIDFPGISILDYAGGGTWKREEDFWSVKGRETAMQAYAEACRLHDPEHPRKHTRLHWGTGPDWTRAGRSYAERPRVR